MSACANGRKSGGGPITREAVCCRWRAIRWSHCEICLTHQSATLSGGAPGLFAIHARTAESSEAIAVSTAAASVCRLIPIILLKSLGRLGSVRPLQCDLQQFLRSFA